MDCLKIAVPALLYLVQNTLLYVALSNLSAPLFQVTYQAKLVTTAIVSVLMLGRSYSPKQWLCLVALSAGVAIVVLGETKEGESTKSVDANKPVQSLTVGLVAITIACFCSALAGVYFEKVLKVATTDKDGSARAPVSVWMRNFQLALFSVAIALLQNAGTPTPEGEEPKGYLHGFTPLVWILVILQAGGGLLVAAVIKYADNVLKGLATGVSVVAATLFSMIIFGTPLSNQFSVGAVLILLAVYFFANDLPAMCLPKIKKGDEELEAMLPSK
jgi:solute carrier family 35 (UDP-sugar transporter), member A1/2/3